MREKMELLVVGQFEFPRCAHPGRRTASVHCPKTAIQRLRQTIVTEVLFGRSNGSCLHGDNNGLRIIPCAARDC